MTNQLASGGTAGNPVNRAPSSVAPAQVQISPGQAANPPGASNNAGSNSQHQRNQPKNILGRLTVNQWLTFLVSVCSLIVSYFTYKNSADTSDLQKAVSNLATLAAETHRQADAAQQQIVAIGNEQRPWVKANLTPTDFRWEYLGETEGYYLSLRSKVTMKNIGKSPAFNVSVAIVNSWSSENLREMQAKACEDAKFLQDRRGVGHTILPGDEINDWLYQIGSMEPALFTKNTTPHRNSEEIAIYYPTVYGCVIYNTMNENISHHTYVAFQVAQPRKLFNGTIIASPGFKEGIDLPASGILLKEDYNGNYAD